MTHKDIYTKFMIEYDKANVTSSYPSLTKYEIATLLDKAYLALIAQKLTGINPRQALFESDVKAIEDLRPLIITKEFTANTSGFISAINERLYNLPNDLLYYLQSIVDIDKNVSAIDNKNHNKATTILMSHEVANKYRATHNNLPWINEPIVYLEGGLLHLLFDTYSHDPSVLIGTYIRKPKPFVISNGTSIPDEPSIPDVPDTPGTFELSDTMAEELINLAISFALESVEQPRLNTKLQLRQLES